MPELELVLITGRSLGQGESLENKFSPKYFENAAVVELDPEDMERLGVGDGDSVRVETEHGSVVLRARKSRRRHPGVAFVPMGPWAGLVVDPRTYGSGMPTLKGVRARVAPSRERPLTLRELVKRVAGVEIPEIPETPSPGASGGGSDGVVEDVTCTFCGCLCDDLVVEVSGGRITRVLRACSLGASKILGYMEGRILKPYVREGNRFVEVSLEEAIKRAAKILHDAKYPLLYGWSSTSAEAIRIGLELAEYLGGVFDNTSVLCHGPTVQAVQETGFVTATLGQVRNYADLIVYWGCNPLNAHPRHLARYSALAPGIYVKGRRDRKVVVIDVRETDTAKVADLFVRVLPGRDYELATALRALVKGYDVEAEEVAGVKRETIERLYEMMITAKFGVIFYGMGLTMTEGKSRNVEAIIRLVQELNEWTKFVAVPMRGHYNVVGANMVTAWATGYPFAVDFSRGYPRYNPGETSATDLLERGEVDAALIVASDPVAHFPARAVRNLAEIPVVTIDPKWNATTLISQVVIPSAIAGIECEGTAYRMDKVPVPLKKVVDPPPGVLPDEVILTMLLEEVRRLG